MGDGVDFPERRETKIDDPLPIEPHDTGELKRVKRWLEDTSESNIWSGTPRHLWRVAKRLLRTIEHRQELHDREVHKLRTMRDAEAHVIVEGGVVPGVDYSCRCDECRSVAVSMAEVGYLNHVKDKWWE